jgi:hypothetical protein
MPVNLLKEIAGFDQEDVILASDAGLLTRRALTVDPDKIQANADGEKVIRPGVILYKIAGATKHRVGLRANLAAAITASSTTSLNLGEIGKVYQSKAAQYFAPGDVVKVLRPYATITISGTWAEANVLTLVVNGQTKAVTAGSSNTATVATTVAAAINADPSLSKVVLAIAGGSVVYLFSQSLEPFSLSATENASGDATVSAVTSGVTVGTIDTAGVNVAAGTVTLAAAAAVTLPAGAPVGVEGEAWGLVVGPHNAGKFDSDVTGYTGGAVYGERLPYWDGDIANALDQIYFV